MLSTANMSQKETWKFKPGTVALREIRRYQRGADLLIPKISFGRVVREILHDLGGPVDKSEMISGDYRIQVNALQALQEATEAFLSEFFTSKCITHLHYP